MKPHRGVFTCLEGKKCAASLFIQLQTSLKLLSAIPGTAGGTGDRRYGALLLLSNCHKRKSRSYLFLYQTGRSRNIGKGAAQAPQQQLKNQCVILLVEMKLQPSQKGRCVDKSRAIKINQVLIARPQRDCRRYQQYLQMRKNGEVVLKHLNCLSRLKSRRDQL